LHPAWSAPLSRHRRRGLSQCEPTPRGAGAAGPTGGIFWIVTAYFYFLHPAPRIDGAGSHQRHASSSKTKKPTPRNPGVGKRHFRRGEAAATMSIQVRRSPANAVGHMGSLPVLGIVGVCPPLPGHGFPEWSGAVRLLTHDGVSISLAAYLGGRACRLPPIAGSR
jgi:hypothetical protein